MMKKEIKTESQAQTESQVDVQELTETQSLGDKLKELVNSTQHRLMAVVTADSQDSAQRFVERTKKTLNRKVVHLEQHVIRHTKILPKTRVFNVVMGKELSSEDDKVVNEASCHIETTMEKKENFLIVMFTSNRETRRAIDSMMKNSINWKETSVARAESEKSAEKPEEKEAQPLAESEPKEDHPTKVETKKRQSKKRKNSELE